MSEGWFAGLAADEVGAGRVRDGSADAPDEWPTRAIESGFAVDEGEYYARLHETAISAARDEMEARERADDQQVIHAVRAMDDAGRMANELAERVAEWAGSRYPESGTGLDYCRELADTPIENPADERLVALAERAVALDAERASLERYVERVVRTAAPNLAALAGPTLAARLLALAGGLESLAKTSSSTMQVLGAEEALFAHLRGQAPSPKHGVIYVHEYVRGTRPEKRGSAARALAGKLTIAARIDHYAGDRRPDLETDLDERMRQIRTGGEDDGAA
ncbi:NOP5/NOP56 family protein [Halococcus sp. AFM35]|uniref:NOP5/NOP56 family protein n=1 Tax=Halococcus sp. AFM35 TaxID=3421653 RepID=UPI003EB6F5C9